jgi:hypothetical protein
MLSLRSIWREADMQHAPAIGKARQIPSTSLKAGFSELKSLKMTPGRTALLGLTGSVRARD